MGRDVLYIAWGSKRWSHRFASGSYAAKGRGELDDLFCRLGSFRNDTCVSIAFM